MHKISGTIRSAPTDTGSIVLDINRGQIFGTNRVGSRILALLDSGYTESQIAEMISMEFGIAEHVVRTDLDEFVASLRANHVLEPETSSGGL